jgi:uncharacterized protein RhaS with RHS repeats
VPAAPDYAPSLAASGRRLPSQRATSPLKTRVGVFCRRPPGRHRVRRSQVARLASGCPAHGYKTASGRGKWLNRDPLGIAGGLNLYAYVGNNPISGVDPLGLVVFYVHGTWSNGTADTFPTSFVNAVQAHFDDPNARFFNWSGENNDAARQAAAFALAQQINAYKKQHPCEPIEVVAHSHGGNVALLASQKSGVYIDELLTLGTPIMSDYRPGNGLGNWDNVYSTGDRVQTLPIGAGRTDPDANNIQLTGYSHGDLHTVGALNAAFPPNP